MGAKLCSSREVKALIEGNLSTTLIYKLQPGQTFDILLITFLVRVCHRMRLEMTKIMMKGVSVQSVSEKVVQFVGQ